MQRTISAMVGKGSVNPQQPQIQSGECRRQPHSSQYRLLQRADKESVSRIIR